MLLEDTFEVDPSDTFPVHISIERAFHLPMVSEHRYDTSTLNINAVLWTVRKYMYSVLKFGIIFEKACSIFLDLQVYISGRVSSQVVTCRTKLPTYATWLTPRSFRTLTTPSGATNKTADYPRNCSPLRMLWVLFSISLKTLKRWQADNEKKSLKHGVIANSAIFIS